MCYVPGGDGRPEAQCICGAGSRMEENRGGGDNDRLGSRRVGLSGRLGEAIWDEAIGARRGNEVSHGEWWKDETLRFKAGKLYSRDGNKERLMGLEFQVSDVRKPLAAVWRIAEKGNIVQFGPTDADCFIQNIRSQEKVGLRRKGGSYAMAVDFAEKDGGEVFQRRA